MESVQSTERQGMMIKKILIIMCTGIFSLTGCAATGLVHDKNYLRAVSITEGAETELTMTFFTGEEKTVTVSGEDISTAMKNAEILTGKPVFTGYTELVVLGNGRYEELLEFLLNDWKVSPSCIISHSDYGSGILSKEDAEILAGSIKQAWEQGKAPKCDIITVLGDLLDKKSSAEIAELTENGVVGTYKIE